MKTFLLPLLSASVVLSLLSGCIAIDPMADGGGYGGGGGYSGYGVGPSAPPPSYGPSYGGGYNGSYNGGSYNGGGYDRHDHDHDRDYDRGPRQDPNRNYFGGREEWYKSGYALGKKDRREHESCNYRRHKNHYDGRTEGEFSHGYNDGYGR